MGDLRERLCIDTRDVAAPNEKNLAKPASIV